MAQSKRMRQVPERPAEMSPLALKITEGLDNALAFVEGRSVTGRVTQVEMPDPAPEYGSADVRRIRQQCGLTQDKFAKLMNVSAKNVEAWESGTKKHGPPSRRLMQLVEEPEILKVAAKLAGYKLVPIKAAEKAMAKGAARSATEQRSASAGLPARKQHRVKAAK